MASTWWSGASWNRTARNGSSRVTSKPRRVSAARAPASPSAVHWTASSSTGRPDRIRWAGSPSTSGKTVRRDSWRSATWLIAPRSAGTSRVPLSVQHHGDVVGAGPGVEAVQEPEPALGEGERNDGRAFHRLQRVRVAGSQLKRLREGRHGGLFKHGPQGRGDAGPVPQQGHQPGCQQGVPAEVEEVIVQSHGVEPQDFLEGLGHDPFPLVAGRGDGGFLSPAREARACPACRWRSAGWPAICCTAAGTM